VIFFISKDKSAFKGTRFESIDAVKAKATEVMKKLRKRPAALLPTVENSRGAV
jgi:hypothetical protein